MAVARALQGQAQGKGCIVFDESTQVLPPEAVPPFFDLLRALARQGTSVILVSHRLDEVMAVTDHITVLRDGCVAGELTTAATTETEVARPDVGRHPKSRPPSKCGANPAGSDRPSLHKALADASAATSALLRHLAKWSGLTGRSGSGYEEVPYLLAGSASGATGAVRVGEYQIDLSVGHPAHLTASRTGSFIPRGSRETRARDGAQRQG